MATWQKCALGFGLALALFVTVIAFPTRGEWHPDSGSYVQGHAYRPPLYPLVLRGTGSSGGDWSRLVRWQWALGALSFALWSSAVFGLLGLVPGLMGLLFFLLNFEHLAYLSRYLGSIMPEGLGLSWVWLFSAFVLLGKSWGRSLGWAMGLVFLLGIGGFLNVRWWACFPLVFAIGVWGEKRRALLAGIFLVAFGVWNFLNAKSVAPFSGIATIGLVVEFSSPQGDRDLSPNEQAFLKLARDHLRVAADPNAATWADALPAYKKVFGLNSLTQDQRVEMNQFFFSLFLKSLVRKPVAWLSWAIEGFEKELRAQRTAWLCFGLLALSLLFAGGAEARLYFLGMSSAFCHLLLVAFFAGNQVRYQGMTLQMALVWVPLAVFALQKANERQRQHADNDRHTNILVTDAHS